MMKFLRRLFGIKPKQMPLPGMQRDRLSHISGQYPPRRLPDAPAMRNVPKPATWAAPPVTRRVSSFSMSPAARASDDGNDLANALLLHSMLTSSSAEPPICRAPEPAPAPAYSSGGGGDFGGGGAESSWSSDSSSSSDSGSSSSND